MEALCLQNTLKNKKYKNTLKKQIKQHMCYNSNAHVLQHTCVVYLSLKTFVGEILCIHEESTQGFF